MAYGKKEIYELLEASGIDYYAVEHKAVYTMEEMDEVGLPEPETIAKNLFVRDGKKKNYFLIVVNGEERVDLKKLGSALGVKGLSFCSEKRLNEILGLYAGAVSPLGVLNDSDHRTKVVIDSRFEGGRIAMHPNDNTASVYMAADDLFRLLTEHGADVRYMDLSGVLKHDDERPEQED
jgi:Ala-tRNA(Pro) deacylase